MVLRVTDRMAVSWVLSDEVAADLTGHRRSETGLQRLRFAICPEHCVDRGRDGLSPGILRRPATGESERCGIDPGEGC